MILEKNEYLFIDGFSLIFRAYYSHAKNPLYASDGMPTSAIFGFSSMMIKILTDYKPDNVMIALDSGKDTFRKKIYDDYKANRTEAPDELKMQFEPIFQIIDAMGIHKYKKDGYEADDIIGSMSNKIENENCRSFIISGDRDLFQLLSQKTRMLFLSGGLAKSHIYDPSLLAEKFQLTPEQIPDYKALAGDASDNIPGVRGIGDKTAKSLLKEYKTLDGIYENIENISGAKKREKLENDKENAYLSLKLARIKTDMDFDFNKEKLQWQGVNLDEMNKIFDKYEVGSLKKRLLKLENVGVQGWLY